MKLPNLSRLQFVLAISLVAILLGSLKRLAMPGSPDFPLGEGGLFVLFSEIISSQNYSFPISVTYGGYALPFAYPPASFYVAAVVSDISGMSLLSVYHYLPRILNILALPAFCFLAANYTKDRIVFAAAVILFSLMPESYTWQITGGGMPRALGALFALLAVGVSFRLALKTSILSILTCGFCVAAAILSHLEWGIFAAVGVALVLLSRAPWRRALVSTTAVGLVSGLGVAPWLLTILSLHGIHPFLSSASASEWSAGAFIRHLLDVDFFASLLTVPAILGVARTFRERDFFAIAWALLILLLTPRMGQSSGLSVPTALLAAHGVREAGVLAAKLLLSVASGRDRQTLAARCSKTAVNVSITIMGALTAIYFTAVPFAFTAREQTVQVDRPSRAAMEWVSQHTEQDSQFVVISPAGFWFFDRIAEWFPYLAGRASLTTAQGLEWAGPGAFTAKVAEVQDLKTAQAVGGELLPIYVRRHYCSADYVALFAPPDADERKSFGASADFLPVFTNESSAVFRRTAPPCRP